MEVGDAYNAAVETILGHEQLKKFKYMLTLEEDNMPPPDGLLKLYESIDEYAAVGGLYWTKGEGGQPMIYGDPKGILSFQPQQVQLDTVQECNGLGMGFTLFDMDVFRDKKIPKPWFKTVQEWDPQKGVAAGTQDLHFFANARRAGYRVACDTRDQGRSLSTQEREWFGSQDESTPDERTDGAQDPRSEEAGHRLRPEQAGRASRGSTSRETRTSSTT